VVLARFLFGTDPEPALRLIRPAGLASNGPELLVCDTALNATLRWDSAAGELSERSLAERPGRPVAVEVAPNGDLLIADMVASAVRRYDAAGNLLGRYAPDSSELRPADVLCVDQTVWVSNVRAHRIEVFDAGSGQHLRSIGGRGPGPGEFGMPLGMARAPSGEICVVDMLNGRVQVLDAEGNWMRDIGRPGDRVGCFGRPKDVAIGPDGTVFVSDAALQCVHVFAAEGQPLLAFGQPVVNGGGGLAVPAGITTCMRSPIKDATVPAGLTPAYYVLVAEQMREPGIRVYAWLGGGERPEAPTAPGAPVE
jgi:hypothetical protein